MSLFSSLLAASALDPGSGKWADEVGSGFSPSVLRGGAGQRGVSVVFPLLVFVPVSTCVFVSTQEAEAGEEGPQSVLISHIPSLRQACRRGRRGQGDGAGRQQAAGSSQPPF